MIEVDGMEIKIEKINTRRLAELDRMYGHGHPTPTYHSTDDLYHIGRPLQLLEPEPIPPDQVEPIPLENKKSFFSLRELLK